MRADGLHRVDVDHVAELGVRTVIDLRTDEERATRGAYAATDVDVHHLPILDVVPDAQALEDWARPGAMAEEYLRMLHTGADAISEVLAILSDPAAYPAVFHCAAGKDRTGVVAAVVLGILGVTGDQIVEDYALSGPAMRDMLEWIRTEFPDAGDELERRVPAMLHAEPATMIGFLEGVRERYGSFKRYARTIGVATAIPHIQAALLD